jgi:hypothetical protein
VFFSRKILLKSTRSFCTRDRPGPGFDNDISEGRRILVLRWNGKPPQQSEIVWRETGPLVSLFIFGYCFRWEYLRVLLRRSSLGSETVSFRTMRSDNPPLH